MGIFAKKKIITELRAEVNEGSIENVLLSALLGTSGMSKEKALAIPSVQSCIKFAGDMVSMIPLKLYEIQEGTVIEVKDDQRVRLLNDETGDTLNAVEFWRAMITDYYLGKGGYAYINKRQNNVLSIHYVDEKSIGTTTNTDPIFKDYSISVNGTQYRPFDFVKLLRNTKDGAKGSSIIDENSLILSVAYQTMIFENVLVEKGGNKGGFLKSDKKLSTEAILALKAAWRNLYSNNTDNVIILNEGMEFQQASSTSVEMQLNENKMTNSAEICKLFNFPANVINGKGSKEEFKNAFNIGILPLLKAITCAVNKDLRLETEKNTRYWAFDTKEMLKGDIKDRFEAYKVGIDANFLQIDEVRYMEDLPALGLNWIKLGLDSVLYDIETGQIFTPNTGQTQDMNKLVVENEPKNKI